MPGAQIYIDEYGTKYTTSKWANLIDELILLARGHGHRVTTDSDWELIDKIVSFWIDNFPNEYQELKSINGWTNQSLKNRHGLLSDDTSNEANIRQVGSMSPRVLKLIQIIYPEQRFSDRVFQRKFMRKFPVFSIGRHKGG